MPNVVWTEEARTNLAGIRGYIGQFSPLNAQRFSAKLARAIDSLASLPERGRPIDARLRELTIVWPYIVRYRVTNEAIYILRIRHGARRP